MYTHLVGMIIRLNYCKPSSADEDVKIDGKNVGIDQQKPKKAVLI